MRKTKIAVEHPTVTGLKHLTEEERRSFETGLRLLLGQDEGSTRLHLVTNRNIRMFVQLLGAAYPRFRQHGCFHAGCELPAYWFLFMQGEMYFECEEHTMQVADGEPFFSIDLRAQDRYWNKYARWLGLPLIRGRCDGTQGATT